MLGTDICNQVPGTDICYEVPGTDICYEVPEGEGSVGRAWEEGFRPPDPCPKWGCLGGQSRDWLVG